MLNMSRGEGFMLKMSREEGLISKMRRGEDKYAIYTLIPSILG